MSFTDYFIILNYDIKSNYAKIIPDLDLYIKSNNQTDTQLIIPINNKNHYIIFDIILSIQFYNIDCYINNLKVLNNDKNIIKSIINNIDEQYLKQLSSCLIIENIITNFNLLNNINDFKIIEKLFLLLNRDEFIRLILYLKKHKKFNEIIYLLNVCNIDNFEQIIQRNNINTQKIIEIKYNYLTTIFIDITQYTIDELTYVFKIYEILNNKNYYSYTQIFKSIFFRYFRYDYFIKINKHYGKFTIDLYNKLFYFVTYYKNNETFIKYIENNTDINIILLIYIDVFKKLGEHRNKNEVKQIFKLFNKIMAILIDINKNVSDYKQNNHNLLYLYLNSGFKSSKKILKSLYSKNLTLQNENYDTCKNISDYNILKYIKSELLTKEEFIRLFLNKIILYSNIKYIKIYEKIFDLSFDKYKYIINYNNEIINVSLLNAAACNKDENVLLYFSNKCNIIDINDNKYKLTPLHCAIFNNNVNNTKILLEKSNLNLLDSENNNYINFGINNNVNLNIFELLCSRNNINIYIKNNNGFNCIINIIKKDNKDYLNIIDKYYGINNLIVKWIQSDYNML